MLEATRTGNSWCRDKEVDHRTVNPKHIRFSGVSDLAFTERLNTRRLEGTGVVDPPLAANNVQDVKHCRDIS